MIEPQPLPDVPERMTVRQMGQTLREFIAYGMEQHARFAALRVWVKAFDGSNGGKKKK